MIFLRSYCVSYRSLPETGAAGKVATDSGQGTVIDMPDRPYLYERQVEYWTTREIEGFFLDSGFEVIVLPITQLTERDVPADFLFLDSQANKLFGLQYKALYYNRHDYWNLDSRQHHILARFDWIYYGLSDLKASKQHRNALHYLRVLETKFDFTAKLPPH
jgi:hypothetical protein